ncbi:MAG: endonuclease III [Candidatus Heimdallarchaeaceae archaeon]
MSLSLAKKAIKIVELLEQYYSLDDVGVKKTGSPFQFLAAVILTAQSTDKQVNAIVPKLFKRFPTPKEMANASVEEIEQYIKSVGLYKNKARFLKKMSQMLIEEYGGQIPQSIDGLTKLPGVGRKSANVVLNDFFGLHQGIAVDTHVKRISYRLGLTKQKNVLQIERDLKKLIPKEKWGKITKLLIAHGRTVCKAIKPRCNECFLNKLCEKKGL